MGAPTSEPLFAQLFDACAVVYVGAFCAAVHWTTTNAAAKILSLVVATAVPAMVATCGLSWPRAATVWESYRKEFVGMVVMIVATCSCGVTTGRHYGAHAEWAVHYLMMMLADASCGGPQVNASVTVALYCAGGFGVDWRTAVANVSGQLGGGLVGWELLTWAASTVLEGAPTVGGPAPCPWTPVDYLALCEFVGTFALVLAVFAFATTLPFADAKGPTYLAKMGLINAVLRTVIVHCGLTGPALNPSLASSFALFTDARGPGVALLSETHVATYWLGGLAGAVACACAWKALTKLIRPKSSFPDATVQIAAAVYLVAFALVLWTARLAPEANKVADAANYANAMASRHPLKKLLRLKPAKSRYAPGDL